MKMKGYDFNGSMTVGEFLMSEDGDQFSKSLLTSAPVPLTNKFKIGDRVFIVDTDEEVEIEEVKPPIKNRGNGLSIYKVKGRRKLFNETQLTK